MAEKREVQSKEPDYEAIAKAMGERLAFAITHFTVKGTGLVLNSETMKSQHWKDYFADAIELMPGTKVNRIAMHMTLAQRKRYAAKKVKK